MDVMALLHQALEASSKLREMAKKIENAEFKIVLADLHSSLADAKLESGELKMKLAAALDQIAALNAQLQIKEMIAPTYTSEGVYTFSGGSGRFCTACWDDGQHKIRLTAVPEDFRFAGKWSCPRCKSYYSPE